MNLIIKSIFIVVFFFSFNSHAENSLDKPTISVEEKENDFNKIDEQFALLNDLQNQFILTTESMKIFTPYKIKYDLLSILSVEELEIEKNKLLKIYTILLKKADIVEVIKKIPSWGALKSTLHNSDRLFIEKEFISIKEDLRIHHNLADMIQLVDLSIEEKKGDVL